MKTFRDFLNEETMPFAATSKGVIDVRDAAVRDGINMQLTAITNGKFITPYIALERVSKALANFHIFLPKYSFLEGDSGMATYEVNQFGLKMGQTDDGRVVTADDDIKYFIFFEYRMSDCGMFRVFAELVDADELEEIMTDVEAELSGETEEDEDELNEEAQLGMPETGARPTPGSSQPAIVTGVTIPDELEGKNRDKMKSKLEKKSLEELNMSDEQQMDDKKLDEEQINELSSGTYKSAMKKAANKAMWSATDKGYKKYSGMARKFQKKGMEQEKKEKNQVDESDDWFFNKKKKDRDVTDMERPKTKTAGYTYVHKTSGKEITKATKGKPSDEWKRLKEEQLTEISKKTLASYIKKASHDVATKSAAVGRYADRANKVKDEMKKGDYTNYKQGKKDDEFADKMFNKSWKRRKGIEKATDKMMKEEQIDEVSKGLAYRAAVSAFTAADKAKIADKKLGMFDTSQHNKRMKKDAQGKKFLNYMSKKVDEEQINELSPEMVGKVNKARLEKPSKTAAADQTRNRAVKKAWLKSKVGELKK